MPGHEAFGGPFLGRPTTKGLRYLYISILSPDKTCAELCVICAELSLYPCAELCAGRLKFGTRRYVGPSDRAMERAALVRLCMRFVALAGGTNTVTVTVTDGVRNEYLT